MVIIFLLMIFVLAQVFLSETLSGRESALEKLGSDMSELTELLNLERKANKDLRDNMAGLSQELQASIRLRDEYALKVKNLEDENLRIETRLEDAFKTIEADKETIEMKLAEIAKLQQDAAALEALRDDLIKQVKEQGAKLEQKEGQLIEERELAESERAQRALLNKQMTALRNQLAAIQEALEASEAQNKEQKAKITSLGKRLNAALATKVQELSKYRSEFFGELRKILGNRSGIRIVGDRFVFQSEVLFNSGQATLEPAGRQQLEQLAQNPLLANKIVLGLDARQGKLAVEGWLETTETTALEVARRVDGWPLAGIVFTDIATDGTLAGPNLESTREIAEATSVPVVASGGVGTLDHLRRLRELPVFGSIVGRALYDGAFTIEQALAAAERGS